MPKLYYRIEPKGSPLREAGAERRRREKVAILKRAALWLNEHDPDSFHEGCGDVSVALERFAEMIGLENVVATAGTTPKTGFHAWLEVDGVLFDPVAFVEGFKPGKYKKDPAVLSMLVCGLFFDEELERMKRDLIEGRELTVEAIVERAREILARGVEIPQSLFGFDDPDEERVVLRRGAQGALDLLRPLMSQQTLTLYRGLNLEDEDDLDVARLGVFWTWDEEGAVPYHGRKGHYFVLRAVVDANDVDWLHSAGLIALRGTEEMEARLKPGAPVYVETINGEPRGIWGAAEAAGARRSRKQYDECFVVVHLSSIDSYASYAGRDAAESLSAEIVMAARAASCVIAIDQGWDGRLGRQLLRDLNEVAAPIIFKHDEDTDGWEGFEQDFPALLHDLGVRRVVLGGLWREGCVSGVKDILEARGFQVSIDEEASGSESVWCE